MRINISNLSGWRVLENKTLPSPSRMFSPGSTDQYRAAVELRPSIKVKRGNYFFRFRF